MIKPILFRGGMYGDLIIGMLDPRSLITSECWQKEYVHSTCAGKNIKYTRTFMKKFFQYTDLQKKKYYESFERVNSAVYFLTHDTDFSLNYKDITSQIVCSDQSMFEHFAKRFQQLHRPLVIQEAKKMIDSQDDFVNDYKKSLLQWQEAFVFPRRFDIKNLYNRELFIDDLDRHFGVVDHAYAREIYITHFSRQ